MPRIYKRRSIEEVRASFLKRVVTTDSCWIWMGVTGHYGYGSLWFEGKTRWAHRVSFHIFKEPIPKGLLVMHSCDNPWCVNPNHLFSGTQKDNIQDALKKGRFKQAGRWGDIKKRCKVGHDMLDKANLYISPKGTRTCNICRKVNRKIYKAKLKEQRHAQVS